MVANFNSFDESPFGVFTESPLGVRRGGVPSRVVWATDGLSVYQLSAVDFIVLNAEDPDGAWTEWGIGGDADTVWVGVDSSGGEQFVAELHSVDLTKIIGRRSADLPATPTFGCGGNAEQIWFCENNGDIYDIYPVDFSDNRPPVDSGYSDADGVGGTRDTLWFCASPEPNIFKLRVSDYTVERLTSSPGTPGGWIEGMGGGDDVAYVANFSDDTIWVYDKYLNPVSGPHEWLGTHSLYGIGGT